MAIAIRFKAPIFTFEAIINEAGIILDKDVISTQSIDQRKVKKILMTLKIVHKELEGKLNEAIENEDYELASKIRDEINKRS